MKFKLLVLLMALCLLLIGCDATDANNTTAPSQPATTIDYEDDTIIYEPIATGDSSGGSLDFELPEEISGGKWNRILSNTESSSPSLARRSLTPWEVEIYELVK